MTFTIIPVIHVNNNKYQFSIQSIKMKLCIIIRQQITKRYKLLTNDTQTLEQMINHQSKKM